MSADSADAENLKNRLSHLSGVVSVGDVSIIDGRIENITLDREPVGMVSIRRLEAADAAALYNFYFHGLSEESRTFFPPYPLFSPPVGSAEELAKRITDWQTEEDWTVLKLVREGEIIGIALLKRYKTERPVSGLAVGEDYRRKGLGFLLQSIIDEQAGLLGLSRLYATLAPENTASLKVHRKCGFKETGSLVPHYVYRNGEKTVDRHDIEMVLHLDRSENDTVP